MIRCINCGKIMQDEELHATVMETEDGIEKDNYYCLECFYELFEVQDKSMERQ